MWPLNSLNSNSSGKSRDAPATRNGAAAYRPLRPSDWLKPLPVTLPSAPQHLPQTHSGIAASADNDIQSSCGSSAALGEKEERKRGTSPPQTASEVEGEGDGERRREEKRLWS